MAKDVRGTIVGGQPRDFQTVETVAEVAAALGASDRTAMVNGVAAEHSMVLPDYAFVTFTDKKKGG